MKKFVNVLNKKKIWLRQDPEEIRGNIKNLIGELEDYYYILRKNTIEWLIPPLALFIRLIDYGQGEILAMRVPIQMMRILRGVNRDLKSCTPTSTFISK